MRPALVATFLAPLVVVQAWGQVEQVREGFRPFGAPPHRVAFSWDMFAVKVERCVVSFDPPIDVGGRVVSSYAALRPPVEWDVVWDVADDYEAAARDLACPRGAHAEVRCFVANGTEVTRRVACDGDE
jgi:hypothetical protein